MKFRMILAVVPLTMALTACGGGDTGDGIASAGGPTGKPGASPSASMDEREAQLKYAECMRENGIDMPDPDEKGRVTVRGKKGDEQKMDKAQKACRPLLDAAGIERRQPSQEERDRMLKFAQCMREHGVDMPDPGKDGGIRLRAPEGGEKKVEEAQKACRKYAPEGPGGGK